MEDFYGYVISPIESDVSLSVSLLLIFVPLSTQVLQPSALYYLCNQMVAKHCMLRMLVIVGQCSVANDTKGRRQVSR